MPSRARLLIAILALAASTARAQDVRQLYRSLTALRVDPSRVYTVHNLFLRRNEISLTFSEGRLAFFAPLDGRITGAVFLGQGRAVAVPEDPAERASLARFLGVPLLDQPFNRAYLRFTDGAAAVIEHKLAHEALEPTNDPVFVSAWDAALAKLNPAYSLRVLADWLSADPKPFFYAALDGGRIGPFDVLVDNRRLERVLIGQSRQSNGIWYFDTWASYPGEDAVPPQLPFQPLHYAIETTIADDLSLAGKTVIHLKALESGDRMIGLELSRFLHVDSLTDGQGRLLVFFQNEEVEPHKIAEQGNDFLYAVLPVPVSAGQDFRLQVAYHGTVIKEAGNGVYFVGARGSWYPHTEGNQFAAFNLTFRWPRRLTLVATGSKLSESVAGKQRVGHWHTLEPAVLAGFNLGEYARQDVGVATPDVSLYANQQLEDAILERLRQNSEFLDSLSPPSLRPPGELNRSAEVSPKLPPPNPSAELKRLGDKLLDSIHFFEKLNGPFPFQRLDVSQIPGSFGQGWPGLLYLPTLVFLPPRAQQQVGVAERGQEELSEIVPYHEIAHQWWGNVVSPSSYRDTWLTEAMANYLALMYTDSKKPSQHILRNWLERYRDALLSKEPNGHGTIEEAGPLDFGFRLVSSKTPDAYDTVIYDKGTWVIHMLRMMLRDASAADPDHRFRELLRSVLKKYRFRTLSTDEFEQEVERVMTRAMDLEGNDSMDWFFEEWVRETGMPSYAIEFRARPTERNFVVSGTLRQSDVSDLFTAPVPIFAARPGGKAIFLGDVITTGPQTKFRFVSSVRPARLLIDPQLTVLCRTNRFSKN